MEPPLSFYLYVPDVDASYNKALAAGSNSIMAPDDMFWGERYCMVDDINGFRWGFGSLQKK
ncbi:VOC family protein [Undibacterium arcticum]|uniref:VOC family protein n=1 Tax=Undibacterium arcticum TaxID=1762892 RepID=UPI003608D77D